MVGASRDRRTPTDPVAPLVRASGAVLDRLFFPHGPSAYFRWVTPSDPADRVERSPRATSTPTADRADRVDRAARSTTTRSRPEPAEGTRDQAAGRVAFERSGLTAVAEGTLLETAEASGLTPPNRCRRGICGTCTTTKTSGTVLDGRTGETSDAPGPIRICVSVAQGDVALDL